MKSVQLAFLATADESWRTLTVQTRSSCAPARILVVPGTMVVAHQVEAQGRTEAQARAAALAGMAEDLATPIGLCSCALGATGQPQRLAFVASRQTVENWVAEARTHAFEPDAILPDFALLPAPGPGLANTTVHGSNVLVRTATGGFSCQPDLATLLTRDLTLSEVEFEASVAAILSSDEFNRLPNLAVVLSAAREDRKATLMPAGLAAAAAVAVTAALPWIDAARLEAATRDARTQVNAIATEALPAGRRIQNPLAQLREASLAGKQAEAGLLLVASVFEGLGQSPGLELTRLELLGDGELRVSLVAPDLSLLQPLRDHLAVSAAVFTATPGASLPNSIPVELSVRAIP